MPKYYSRRPNGSFQIRKQVDGEIFYFGRYDTEQEAKDMVDFLKRHDWDLRYAHIRNPEMKYIVKISW